MDINGVSSSSTSGFKLFGKTIVMPEKDVGQDDIVIAAAEEETSVSRSSNLEEEEEEEEEMSSGKTTTKMAARVLPCPRCKSKETKFCYFNNYNVNQPRHFCKACHRYWTAGGALRNVPVGAGRRQNRTLPPQGGGGSGSGGGAGAEGGGGMCLVGGRGEEVVDRWLSSRSRSRSAGWKCIDSCFACTWEENQNTPTTE